MGSMVVLPHMVPEHELPGLKVPEKNSDFLSQTFLEAPVVVEMVVSVTTIVVVNIGDVGVVDGDTIVPVVHWTFTAQSQFLTESFQRRPDAQAYS